MKSELIACFGQPFSNKIDSINFHTIDNRIDTILLESGCPKHEINSAFKQKLQQLNSNPVHTVEKCPVYLNIRWIGNVSMKFEKQITSAVKRCFFSVKPRVLFTTRQLLLATKKDMLPSHYHSNVIYQCVCHCDSRYVGCTSQSLEERIKQHVSRSIASPPALHNRQRLSRSCKANICPQQFHESAIGQHLLDNDFACFEDLYTYFCHKCNSEIYD